MYEWRYVERIEPDREEAEALTVGSTWHAAFEAHAKGEDPYAVIQRDAPGDLWRVKLSRMFAAYLWYWEAQQLNVVESERQFEFEHAGRNYAGIIDGIVETEDGRRGIVEHKTTGFDLGADSMYWDRLRLDVQVGMYAIAFNELFGKVPDFIIYDVARKPTIRPARIAKKLAEPMQEECENEHTVSYFDEPFSATPEIEAALVEGKECPALYGARLTKDIGERPEHYFARREVVRTSDDYTALIGDMHQQTSTLEGAVRLGMLYRNPDACAVFGSCDYFGLCSTNQTPSGKVPDGFRLREHAHAELSTQQGAH